MADRIRWTSEAAENLEEICSFISKDDPAAACAIAGKIYRFAHTIPEFPLMGRVVPEYGVFDVRERIFSPYRIIYRLKEETVEILAIHHSSRQFPSIDK